MSKRQYFAVVHKDKDSDFGVSWPDLPGCIAVGTSLDEAIRLAHDALEAHIEWMTADDDPIPAPSTLTVVSTHPDASDAVAFVPIAVNVHQTVRRTSKKLNITMDAGVLALIDAEARRRRMSRSAFLAEGAQRLIMEGRSDAA